MKKKVFINALIPASLILLLITSCEKETENSVRTPARVSELNLQSAQLVLEPFAGSGEFDFRNGPAMEAAFQYVSDLATTSNGDLYVNEWNGTTQGRIRKISSIGPAHEVTTFMESGAADLAVSSDGFLYLAINKRVDNNYNGYIYRVNGSGKLKLVHQRTSTSPITSFAIGADKTLYLGIGVWHSDSVKIEKVSPEGVVSLLAGGEPGFTDGTGAAAKFREVTNIAIDDHNVLYVADAFSHTIRKITSTGVVATFAGQDFNFGTSDGTGTAATFNNPVDIAFDDAGNLYTSDYSEANIRKITPDGVVTTPVLLDVWATGLTIHAGTLFIAGEERVIKKVKLY